MKEQNNEYLERITELQEKKDNQEEVLRKLKD